MTDHENIAVVESAARLFSYRRDRTENGVLLPRPITGAFNDLARWLLKQNPWHNTLVADKTHYIETVYRLEDVERFKNAPGMVWHDELDLVCADMRMMQDAVGHRAELRIVRDKGYSPATYLFHKDGGEYRRALQSADRVMCNYNGPTTERIHARDAIALPVSHGFFTFEKRPGALVSAFRVGDIWRQACMGDGSEAMIHRAVEITPESAPRMVLVC